jgi:hypothetical protein
MLSKDQLRFWVKNVKTFIIIEYFSIARKKKHGAYWNTRAPTSYTLWPALYCQYNCVCWHLWIIYDQHYLNLSEQRIQKHLILPSHNVEGP